METKTDFIHQSGAYGYLEQQARKQVEALKQAEEVVLRWLKLRDAGAIHVVLATVVANKASGDPLWMLLVGPPSSGKSEILRGLSKCESIHFLGGLTKSTFVSGFEKHQGLLTSLKDHTTLVIKDFGSLLSMHRDNRAEVLQQLREIYDGLYKKEYGNGKVVEWQGSMGLIGATTNAIENYHSVIGELGNRYILYRYEADEEDRAEIACLALKDEGAEQRMREEIASAFKEVLALAPKTLATIPEDIEKRLISLADLVSRLRSPVSRDSYDKVVNYTPDIEGPARLAKALAKLGKASATVRGKWQMAQEEYETLKKVAIDTVPKRRIEIVSFLLDREWHRTKAIASALDFPQMTATCELEDLMLIKVLKREPDTLPGEEPGQTTPYKWKLRDAITDLISKSDLSNDIKSFTLKVGIGVR